MNLFNFFKNQKKDQEKGKWILKGMFVSLILGLILIPVFSLATNKAPIINAGSDKEVFEGESITLNGSASDPDGDSLILSWACSAGNLSTTSISQPIYTAPLVNFDIYHTCILTAIDSRGLNNSDTVKILVKNKNDGVKLKVLAKNLSRKTTVWQKTVSASSSEEIILKIEITSHSNFILENIMVKNSLPAKMIYQGNLKIDNLSDNRDLTKQAINIGSLKPGQTRIITFQAKIAPAKDFSYGTTELVNAVLVYNVKLTKTGTSKILVTKINGSTKVKTGLSDISFLNSILFPLIVTLLIIWAFKSKLLALDKLIEERQKEITEYRAKKLLKKKIEEIKRKV